DGCESDTSSRYIQVSSGGLAPSKWTLNQSTTFWPAYGVMSKLTWVQVCELESLLKMLASVCPDVVRTCASCQSYTQPLPEQMSSVVAGRYQKLRVVLPVGGIVTVWDRLLSPSTSGADWTLPSRAGLRPEGNWVLRAGGGGGGGGGGKGPPRSVRGVGRFWPPPLSTCNALADGVTALDCADSGPVPAGLDAVTVNV